MRRMLAFVLFPLLNLVAAETFTVCEANKTLQFKMNGLTVMNFDDLVIQTAAWHVIRQARRLPSTYTKCSDGFTRTWGDNGDGLAFTRSVRRLGENQYRITFDFAFAPGIQDGEHLELCLHFVQGSMDFPAETLPVGPFSGKIILPTIAGNLSIDSSDTEAPGSLSFQDMRNVDWAHFFRLHYGAVYDPKVGCRGKVVLTVKLESPISSLFLPISIDQAANRSYADDQQGNGWTGQGPQNCLRAFPAGELLNAGGYPFVTGKQAIILKSSHTPDFPLSSGRVQLPEPASCAGFAFLHTSAWSARADCVIAKYRVHYVDGSSADIPIRFLRDIEDWWNPREVPNGLVAWRGDNGGGHKVAVFMSKAENPHPAKRIAGLEFISANTDTAVAILGVTALRQDILTPSMAKELDKLYTFRAERITPQTTADWFPCALPWQDTIQPDSALDFSGLNHRPAGKFGFVKRVGDHFEFEGRPGIPVRFWGTNFAITGPFPEKDLAPGLAKCMAAQGVNLVRMHLYAARPVLLNAPDGTLKPDMLDRMRFLMAELIKNGVYIYMDLNDGMCYDQLLARPSSYPVEERLKLASLFDRDLIKATKRLAELLFATVNPYTGKRPVDDPGIACYEIMNEVSMLSNWFDIREKLRPTDIMVPKLEKIWAAWLRDNGYEERDMPRNFSLDPVSRRFGIYLDNKYIHEMSTFLRELGVKAPISGTNITFANGNFLAAPDLDYFGDHFYWAHPNFRVNPKTYPLRPSLTQPVHAALIPGLGKSSVVDYPVVHSEWNYCYPNAYRCEGMPLAAAYAAYQDWDGMIFYGATGSCDDGDWNRFRKNPNIQIHSQQTDPATWGLAPIAVNIYRRRDVDTAHRDLTALLPHSALYSDVLAYNALPFLIELGKFSFRFAPDENRNWLGELAMRENVSKEERFRQVLKTLNDSRSDSQRICSDTHQLRRYPQPGLFLVESPKTQLITGRLCELDQINDVPGNLQVTSLMNWGTIALTSLDNAVINESKRMLLVAVGNAANTGQICEKGQLIEMGTTPVRAEVVRAEITVNCRHAGQLQVYAIDPTTGARRHTVIASTMGDYLRWTLDETCRTIYFELAE